MNNKEDELFPCWSCGKEAEFTYDGLDGMGYAHCTDASCGAEIFDNTDDAIKKWNTRHINRSDVERWCADNGMVVVPVGVVGFIKDCVDVQREACGLDGYDLQEQLANAGVLEIVEREEACSETNCVCAEYDSFPLDCYRTTDEAITMIAAAKDVSNGN